jgi:hypothetical protein
MTAQGRSGFYLRANREIRSWLSKEGEVYYLRLNREIRSWLSKEGEVYYLRLNRAIRLMTV